jgi:hypothetical protein
MDPKTGALNLKKGEPWMNTITPELTYLLRGNSDVTSLLSGTAIKAVVAYVTDYITKMSLKTYSIFDVIRSIFDKNSEIIGGDTTRKEKVRKIFTQVVNSLTAKMEIGSPMASLYMLGNPDHYTSHTFVPFYWRSYVKEALNAWTDEDESGQIESLGDVKENVIINKSNGNFIGLSKVNDYIYRPTIYKSTCLYDWIRLATKTPKRRMKAKKAGDPIDDPDFDESDDELNIIPRSKVADIIKPEDTMEFKVPCSNIDENISGHQELFEFDENAVDLEEEAELDELDIMDEVAESVPKKKDYSLQPNHPQHQTHQVRMKKEDPSVVPNFLPNTLPRSDRGDREYYCCTMLTLFKPWRSGKDLKAALQSWDTSFAAHTFTKRQLEIMKYFNVRYECLDARDDFSAKRDKEDHEEIYYQWATTDMLKSLDDTYHRDLVESGADFETKIDDTGDEEAHYNILGLKGQCRKDAMATAERVMRMSGWMNQCEDGLPDVGPLTPIEPSVNQSGKMWRVAVLAKRQEILEDRIKHLPANPQAKNGMKNFKPDEVKVVDKRYINKMFKAPALTDNNLIDETVDKFHLNPEQQRAFHIIANHATMEKPEKLHMYLGGMGGTGKSQVIKALMHFFNERKENHRFLVLAPTGAAAALLNGSTYHSVLGIREDRSSTSISSTSLAQIRAKLDGVDYIFLDEVSMLSCRDMYKISAQCAKSHGEHNEAFGGINFIFAGDFAQLPPVKSGPHYIQVW